MLGAASSLPASTTSRPVSRRSLSMVFIMALATVQVQTRYELHAMESGFPMGDGPEEHEDLIKQFVVAAEAIVDITFAQDVVNKVFD